MKKRGEKALVQRANLEGSLPNKRRRADRPMGRFTSRKALCAITRLAMGAENLKDPCIPFRNLPRAESRVRGGNASLIRRFIQPAVQGLSVLLMAALLFGEGTVLFSSLVQKPVVHAISQRSLLLERQPIPTPLNTGAEPSTPPLVDKSQSAVTLVFVTGTQGDLLDLKENPVGNLRVQLPLNGAESAVLEAKQIPSLSVRTGWRFIGWQIEELPLISRASRAGRAGEAGQADSATHSDQAPPDTWIQRLDISRFTPAEMIQSWEVNEEPLPIKLYRTEDLPHLRWSYTSGYVWRLAPIFRQIVREPRPYAGILPIREGARAEMPPALPIVMTGERRWYQRIWTWWLRQIGDLIGGTD